MSQVQSQCLTVAFVTRWPPFCIQKQQYTEKIVMEKKIHALGGEHPSTLKSMENLAAIYGDQG